MNENAKVVPLRADIQLERSKEAAPTYSLVLERANCRCRYWGKVLSPETARTLDPATTVASGAIPGRYLRSGTDLELLEGTVVLEGEERHHRKLRGWDYFVRIVLADDAGELRLVLLPTDIAAKAKIKASGRAQHLMGGSGPIAACVRVARFVLEGVGREGKWARVEMLTRKEEIAQPGREAV